MSRRIISLALTIGLIFQQASFAQMAAELNLSGYLARMNSGMSVDKFRPEHLRYFNYDLTTHNFKVLLDKGDLKDTRPQQLEGSAKTLLNYFLVGVALNNESFWVNLRPDAEDQIIDNYLAQTDVGRIMLETDLQLKQDTAKLTSPETPEGKEYWNRLYKKAEEIYGYDSVNIPTLTRPWIVPGEIIIHETDTSAYIYKATLKVMLEQDYLKDSSTYNFKDMRSKALNDYSSELIRELIIPKLTKEVNTSKRYANIRQVYYSLILSRWFKNKFAGQSGGYASRINTLDLTGLTSQQPWSKTTYFKAYQKSFKDGEYNIKEPVYRPTGQVVRSYFSGGMDLDKRMDIVTNSQVGIINKAGSPVLPRNPKGVMFEISGANATLRQTGSEEDTLQGSGDIIFEGMPGYRIKIYNGNLRQVTMIAPDKSWDCDFQTNADRFAFSRLEDNLNLLAKGQKPEFDEAFRRWAEQYKDNRPYSTAGSPLIEAGLAEQLRNQGLNSYSAFNAIFGLVKGGKYRGDGEPYRIEKEFQVGSIKFDGLMLRRYGASDRSPYRVEVILYRNQGGQLKISVKAPSTGVIGILGAPQGKDIIEVKSEGINLDELNLKSGRDAGIAIWEALNTLVIPGNVAGSPLQVALRDENFSLDFRNDKDFSEKKAGLEKAANGAIQHDIRSGTFGQNEITETHGFLYYIPDYTYEATFATPAGGEVSIINFRVFYKGKEILVYPGSISSSPLTKASDTQNKSIKELQGELEELKKIMDGNYEDSFKQIAAKRSQTIRDELLPRGKGPGTSGSPITEEERLVGQLKDYGLNSFFAYSLVSKLYRKDNWRTMGQPRFVHKDFKIGNVMFQFLTALGEGFYSMTPSYEIKLYGQQGGVLKISVITTATGTIGTFSTFRGPEKIEVSSDRILLEDLNPNDNAAEEIMKVLRDVESEAAGSPLANNDKPLPFSETIKQIQELVSLLSREETTSADDIRKKSKKELTPEILEYKLREGSVERYVKMAMGALKIASQLKKEKTVLDLRKLLSSLDKSALSTWEITAAIKNQDYAQQAIEDNSLKLKESTVLLSEGLLETKRNLEGEQYLLSFPQPTEVIIGSLLNGESIKTPLADLLKGFSPEDLISARGVLENMPQELRPGGDNINDRLILLGQIIEQRAKDSTLKPSDANNKVKKNEKEGSAGYEAFIKTKKINVLGAVLSQRNYKPQDPAVSLTPEKIRPDDLEVIKLLDDVDLDTVIGGSSSWPDENNATIAEYSERLRPFGSQTLENAIAIFNSRALQAILDELERLPSNRKRFIDEFTAALEELIRLKEQGARVEFRAINNAGDITLVAPRDGSMDTTLSELIELARSIDIPAEDVPGHAFHFLPNAYTFKTLKAKADKAGASSAVRSVQSIEMNWKTDIAADSKDQIEQSLKEWIPGLLEGNEVKTSSVELCETEGKKVTFSFAYAPDLGKIRGSIYFSGSSENLAQPAIQFTEKASSAVQTPGGIDFRALPMTIKPMGSFEGLNLKLPQLSPAELAGFNLSEEIGQMNQMISGGIIPSGARVEELIAAAVQKGQIQDLQGEILTILAEICKLQEGECCEASDELKVALVAANSV